MIEERLPEIPQLRIVGQPVENQGQMQNQQVKTPIYRVRHPIFAIKTGQSRLRHDRAIQGTNGVRPRAAAKQGEFHRIRSGAAARRVTSTPSAVQDLSGTDWVESGASYYERLSS